MDVPFTMKCVWVKARFVAFHQWPEAPNSAAYLREKHRHEFHVKASKLIETDRQIEFIELKDQLNAYIRAAYEGRTFEYSCEAIAEDLLKTFNLHYCDVSEDGENGSTVIRLKVDPEGVIK